MLVNSVSGENKTARMRIWRALKASGPWRYATAYICAKSESARASICRTSRRSRRSRGWRNIRRIERRRSTEFVRLFDREFNDYAELFGKLDSL